MIPFVDLRAQYLRILSLPMYAELSSDAISMVAEAIQEFCTQAAGAHS